LEDLSTARKMWRTLEPYHGMIYFVPEATDAYAALGIEGRMGYFASRAAPMGTVSADVVIATFFNFHPALVRRAIPEAWRRADPEKILQARFEAADAALRRLLGDAIGSGEMREAASLARDACDACTPEGRPLYAGHAALAWPDEPHLVLWHATSLLREYRGDGHIAAMTAEGVSGCEALIVHAATDAFSPAVLQASREWPDDEWDAARDALVARGWIDADGSLTDAGRAHRAWVEERTDVLASPPWTRIGEEACTRLRALVRPWSKAIGEAGTFATMPFRST
jgi:hypothetical protein